MRSAAGVFRLLVAHLQLLSLALDFTASSRAIRKPDPLYSSRGQATPSLAGFRREAFSERLAVVGVALNHSVGRFAIKECRAYRAR